MSPASGNAPLRGIGPEDVDAAGELAPEVQSQNQAHELIKHVAASHPVELVTIQQLEEHAGRSKALDSEEVWEAAEELVGDSEKRGGLVKALSARVKGYDRPVEEMWVIVLYETPSGRNARCAVPYAPEEGDPFGASMRAYDKGVAEGKITEGKASDASDTSHFEAQIDRQRATISRLEKQVEQASAPVEDEPPPAEPPEPPEEVKVPDGVVPGETPGWPLDDDGKVLDLPDHVREALVAAAEAEDVAPEEPADEPPPVDLDAVELPTGKANDLIAGMAFYSDDVVAALAERDERKTVVEAAKAVLAQRTDDAEG